jgi:hypothetical protein
VSDTSSTPVDASGLFGENTMRLRGLRIAICVAAAVACVSWLAVLFFQTGYPWDESEHAHVAWLISQGKRPLDDFFQHHQPLYWHVLSLYYRAGFSGAGVLIWGRVLVALSGLASVASLLSMGRTALSSRVNLAGIGGAAVLVALTLVLPDLFVSRPETLSIALALIAIVLWSAEQPRVMRIFLAGVLAGAACYSSPRFLLLGGFFLLLGENSVRRWAALVLGGVFFLTAYTAISGFSLTKVLFNLEFSSYLQSVADEDRGFSTEYWWRLAATVVLPIAPLLASLRSSDRLRGALLVTNLVVIFAMCHWAAGQFRYPQAYAPFVAAAPVVVTWLLARLQAPADWKSAAGFLLSFFLLVTSVKELAWRFEVPGFHLLEAVRARDSIAAMVPPGRTVFIYADKHPITVPDASYYGSPLIDARNRLCRAVRAFQSRIPLPPCDPLKDLERVKNRPYIVDARLGWAVRAEEVNTLERWMGEHYVKMTAPPDFPPFLRNGLYLEGSSSVDR